LTAVTWDGHNITGWDHPASGKIGAIFVNLAATATVIAGNFLYLRAAFHAETGKGSVSEHTLFPIVSTALETFPTHPLMVRIPVIKRGPLERTR
jgi:hypothetical protein